MTVKVNYVNIRDMTQAKLSWRSTMLYDSKEAIMTVKVNYVKIRLEVEIKD